MIVKTLGSLKNNTAFVFNGHDMVKVKHPTLGFVARNAKGEKIILVSKTPVLVAEKPVYVDIPALIREVDRIHRICG